MTSTIHETVLASTEYAAVSEHYRDRRAERSGLAYMNHIGEGLDLLDIIGAPVEARLAYCLHPMTQGDDDLRGFDPAVASSPRVLLDAIEYRNVANRCLSGHYGSPDRRALLSPVADVNLMLVADKVQNRKDFEEHHALSHPRAAMLSAYFVEWLHALGVDEDRYRVLLDLLWARSR